MSFDDYGVQRQITTYPVVCIHYEEEKRSHGIFYQEKNSLRFIFPVFMAQIILAFMVSRTVYFALRPLRQPRFVCNILAGIILGPSVLGHNKTFMETIFPTKEMLIFNTFATIGTTLFVFLMAVKSDTTRLIKTAKTAWMISISTYFLPFAVIILCHPMIKKHLFGCIVQVPPVYLACALSATYFPIIAHVMEELNLLTTELGQIVMSSAMLMETVSHFISVTITVCSKGNFISAIQGLAAAYAPVVFAIFVLRPILLTIVKNTPPGRHVKEIYVVAVLLGALMMVIVANKVWGLTLTMAFFMGLIVPDGPPLGAALVEKSELLVNEFFMPLFFVQVGYLTDVYSIRDKRTAVVLLLLITATYTWKMLGTLFASLYVNIRLRNAILLGTILNIRGIIDLVVYQRWRLHRMLNPQCYAILVLFNVTFIGLICPLINIFYDPQVRLMQSSSKRKGIITLHSIPQQVELCVLTCIHREENVPSIINLLEASSCKSSRSTVCAYVIHIIELVGRAAPLLTRYNSHNGVLRNNDSDHIVRAFRKYSKNSDGFLAIQPFTMVAPYKTMHNIICNFAEDKNIPLIVVPFHRNHQVDDTQSKLLRNFNSQLQAQAHCTVGILIDKRLYPQKKLNNFSLRVVVLFIGGADDREVLSLAIRMSSNPNVNVTMLRITKSSKKVLKQTPGRQLDELLVKEFMGKNARNPRVVCREEVASGSLQMLNLVKSLKNNHDVVMVGRKPTKMPFEKELMQWIEYPELGVIGDMFVSLEDFCDCEMSVLVLQHSKLVCR